MKYLRHCFPIQLDSVSGESVLSSGTQIAINQCNFYNSIWQSYECLTCSASNLIGVLFKITFAAEEETSLVLWGQHLSKWEISLKILQIGSANAGKSHKAHCMMTLFHVNTT